MGKYKQVNSNGIVLKECGRCGRLRRHLYGKDLLCNYCYKQGKVFMPMNRTLEEALNKTYTIRYDSRLSRSGTCSFPEVLVGKTFKIMLVKSKNGQGSD